MKKVLKNFTKAILFATLAFSVLFPTLADETLTASAATAYADDKKWIESLSEPEDYAYSIAVVGDPQYMTQYDRLFGTNYLNRMYKWIADNVETKKIQHVMNLGDITHNDVIAEWDIAEKAISQLDGVVPYSLVRGNHDNRTTFYDQKFGTDTSAYMNQQTLVSSYDYEVYDYNGSAQARNTAHEFAGANVDYLVVALDFGAQDDVLEWANGVVEAYPNHTVIVTTHAYLNQYGQILDETQGVSPNGKSYDGVGGQYHGGTNGTQASRLWNGKQWKYQAKSLVEEPFNGGDDLWEKFISKHENISMVFCGHVESVDIQQRTMTGDNGNTIQEFVVNPQNIDDDEFYTQGGSPAKVGTDKSLTGMVGIMYCSADGKTIDLQWYSTIKDQFYNEENQFSFEAQTTQRGNPYVKVRTGIGGSASLTYQELTGEPIEITFIPEKYYAVTKVKLNGVDITDQVKNNTYTLTETTGYYNVKVEFGEETRYAFLEQNDLSKGKLTYSLTEPDATFVAGDTFTVKVTPVTGCTVKKVTLNGTELTADGQGNYLITIAAQDNVLAVEYDGEPIAPPTESTPPNEPNEPTTPNEPNEPPQTSDTGCASTIDFTSSLPLMAILSVAMLTLWKKKKGDGKMV